jgi:hypothetical protein
MITTFDDFLHEDRHFVDKKHYNLEGEFEPSELVLQKIYYNELDKIYQTDLNKYRLVLDILKANSKISKKKPNFTYFKGLLKLSNTDLKEKLKKLKDLGEEEFHLPDVKIKNMYRLKEK